MNARRVILDDCPEAVDAYFAEQGWSDGLPIVPPTPERVEAFVAAAGGTPERELGAVPPRNGIATLEKLAINAVMAGCRPEYFPVITTAIAAMLEEPHESYPSECGRPSRNLTAMPRSTHGAERVVRARGALASFVEQAPDPVLPFPKRFASELVDGFQPAAVAFHEVRPEAFVRRRVVDPQRSDIRK